MLTNMKNDKIWRKNSSWFNENELSTQSVQTLIGHFLHDRNSESLLGNKIIQSLEGTWGQKPFEKIIESDKDMMWFMKNPQSLNNTISIIEPADHVGHNLYKDENGLGEEVRASSNMAYISRIISDCDSLLFPIWKSGVLDNDLMMNILRSSMAIVVEGGHPSVRDAKSFENSNISLIQLIELTEQLLLSRNHKSAPVIFICMGHQLVAQAHVNLIKKAVQNIKENLASIINPEDYKYQALISVCNEIQSVGKKLKIIKENKEVANGWDDPNFAVAENETVELGECELSHYNHDGKHPSDDFQKLLIKHNQIANEYDGIVEHSVSYEKNLNILMFHSDEVNEEAVLFANWAYASLYEILASCNTELSVSPLAWVFQMPSSIEILCSTSANGKTLTEVAGTCINYKDYETQKIRRSFSFQFHPELLSDLREFRVAGTPDFNTLKNDDGIRMLMRVLYECMLD